MQKAILVCLLCVNTLWAFAQTAAPTFEVPENAQLEKAEDCDRYDKDILACINWLNATPVDQQKEKRQAANQFFILWLTNTSKVSAVVHSYLTPLTDKNPPLLLAFLTGWTKFALENPTDKDEIKPHVAAIKNLLKIYQDNPKALKKNKKVLELIKMDAANGLEAWVKKQISK